MYKLSKDSSTNEVTAILQLNPWLLIPFDPANTEYQEYLKWVAEGNEPLPADE